MTRPHAHEPSWNPPRNTSPFGSVPERREKLPTLTSAFPRNSPRASEERRGGRQTPCSLVSACRAGFSCPEAESAPGSLCNNLMHMILGERALWLSVCVVLHCGSRCVLCYTVALGVCCVTLWLSVCVVLHCGSRCVLCYTVALGVCCVTLWLSVCVVLHCGSRCVLCYTVSSAQIHVLPDENTPACGSSRT